MPKTFRDVIALWGNGYAGCDACAGDLGLGIYAVRNWRARNNILADYWPLLLKTKRVKKAGLTADHFARMAARRKATARSGAGAETRPG